MKNTFDASEVFKKLVKELADQQREAIALIAERLAAQQMTDKSAIEDVLASHLPDMDDAARQILADAALDAIVREALIQPLARCALTAMVDDCVRKTFAQTGFAEALADNLQKTIDRAEIPSSLLQQMQSLPAENDLEAVAANYLHEAFVAGDFVDLIEERIKSLTSPPHLSQLLCEEFTASAANADFPNLLAQRMGAIVSESDQLLLYNRQIKELTLPKDFAARLHEEGSEINARYREFTEKLRQAVRIESYRRLPYDQFIDRTFGSLPDFTLEGDQPDYAKVGEETE